MLSRACSHAWSETGVPLGRVSGEEVVVLPAGSEDRIDRNLFTGEIVEITERGARRALPLGAVLSEFPVAMLERVKDV